MKKEKDLDIIKKILEDHLCSINENTTEIQALFDYLQELEIKWDKISQRLDNLQLNQGQAIPKPIISPLNQMERKVFVRRKENGFHN